MITLLITNWIYSLGLAIVTLARPMCFAELVCLYGGKIDVYKQQIISDYPRLPLNYGYELYVYTARLVKPIL